MKQISTMQHPLFVRQFVLLPALPFGHGRAVE